MASIGALTMLQNRLVRGGIWVLAGRCGAITGQFALQLLLTRLLSLHDFGVYVLLTSIVIPCSSVAMLGFNRLSVKFIAETLAAGTRDRLDAILRLLVIGGTTSIVSISVVAGVVLHLAIPHFLPELGPWWMAPLVALWIALLSAHQLLAEMLRGFHELRFASMVMGQNGGPVMTFLLVAILLVTAASATISLPLTLLSTVLAFGLILPLLVYWLVTTARARGWQMEPVGIGPPADPGGSAGLKLRRVVRACGLLVSGQVLLFAASQGDLWISGWVLSPADAAVLGAARRLVLVAATPAFLVNMTVLPHIPDLHAQGRLAELQQVLRSSATVATLVSLVLFLPLILFPGYCLRIVYTPQYDSAASLVVALALGTLVYTVFGSSQLTLQLAGREKCAAIIQLIAAGVLFGLGPWAARHFGIAALACVSAITMGGSYVASWLAVRRTLGIWTHPQLTPWTPQPAARGS